MARARGEGCVVGPDARGNWTAILSLGVGPDGRRKRKWLYAKSRHEVIKKLNQAKKEAAQGILVVGRKTYMRDFLEDWLQTKRAAGSIRPSTWRRYESLIRQHVIPGVGHYHLETLLPQDIQAFINRKQQANNLSAQSIRHIHAVLSRALAVAVHQRRITYNPATAGVEVPRIPHREPQFLTEEQARIFLAASASHPLASLFWLAIGRGLRLGELVALRWQDVDPRTETISVRHSMSRDWDGGFSLSETKSPRSRRLIPLPSGSFHKLFPQGLGRPDDYVWHTRSGRPWSGRNVERTYSVFLKRAGLPALPFHCLRKTCSTLLQQRTPGSLLLAQDLLGHSSPDLTASTYTGRDAEGLRRAVGRLDEALPLPIGGLSVVQGNTDDRPAA